MKLSWSKIPGPDGILEGYRTTLPPLPTYHKDKAFRNLWGSNYAIHCKLGSGKGDCGSHGPVIYRIDQRKFLHFFIKLKEGLRSFARRANRQDGFFSDFSKAFLKKLADISFG